MKYLSAILMALLLISCTSKPQHPSESKLEPSAGKMDAGAIPEDYRIRIISWLRMNADDPDAVRVLSIEAPLLKVLETSVPDKDLEKGEPVWESVVLTQGYTGDPPEPTYHRFYFKDGVIRAVDPK
jgi:hypothetical protein